MIEAGITWEDVTPPLPPLVTLRCTDCGRVAAHLVAADPPTWQAADVRTPCACTWATYPEPDRPVLARATADAERRRNIGGRGSVTLRACPGVTAGRVCQNGQHKS